MDDTTPPSVPPAAEVEPLDVEALTWSALLGQCVELAQAAVALPVGSTDEAEAAEARAWSASVPHVIQLQALWFALRRSDGLPADERALGRDRAAVSLRGHEVRLRELWSGVGRAGAEAEPGLPSSLVELVEDVRGLVEAD